MKILIVKLTSYIGEETEMTVFPNPLYMVINAETGEEIDNGYLTFQSAKLCWPESINKEAI